MVSPHGKVGETWSWLHLCPVLPSNTLYGNSHFLSDCVSYSDGCNGEWLVLFLFNFVLLFDGRWDDILAPSAPIQLNRILDFVFPSKLKKNKACFRHKCICCLTSSNPCIRKKPATKAGSCTLLTFSQGLGSLDAMESYCKVLLYFFSLEVEGD